MYLITVKQSILPTSYYLCESDDEFADRYYELLWKYDFGIDDIEVYVIGKKLTHEEKCKFNFLIKGIKDNS
jgi:hypothetical protein